MHAALMYYQYVRNHEELGNTAFSYDDWIKYVYLDSMH